MPMNMTNDYDPAAPLSSLRLGIVGLGLMGGSLALALRGRVAPPAAVDRQPDTRQLALREGIVSFAAEELSDDFPPVDLLVLAAPVRVILDTLGRLPTLLPAGCAVLDLGSTKREVVAAMDALPEPFAAIGGHPMCGKETSGLASAAADLYRDQTFFLCRSRRTTPALEATALALVGAIGARPVFMDAAAHDTAVAAVSHLPALLAAALMRVAAEEALWSVGASGFRDTARLAGSDPRMMLDILLTNREAVLAALAGYEWELAAVRRMMEQGDEAALAEWLATAQVNYAAYRRFKSSEYLLSIREDDEEAGKIA
jgi:prephenate dehydrogenase